MDRSLFPEGVVVSQVDLERTEDTKAFHIATRHISSMITGVVSGGEVTVNTSNNTLVDVNACVGFAPNDEYVESGAQSAMQLADYSSGVINYVIAVYTETNEDLKPHETNGNSYPTSANRNARLRILSETEYNALPDTDNNLNNDAKDRALVLAKITAHGTGASLSSSDIVLPTVFGNAISANNTTGTITGATIYNVDKTTPTGTGYLQYNTATKNITWQSPGTSSYGPPVTIVGSGLITLQGSSGKTLTLYITYLSLPVVGTLTDTITISNIYAQSVARHTAEDLMHRSLVGSGTPTLNNAHGLTLEDLGISAGTVEIHQDLFHSNGILRSSSASLFAAIVNTGDSPDSLNITGPVAGDGWYLNGIEHTALATTNIPWTDVLGVNNQSLWDIYVLEGLSSISTLQKKERARYVNVSPSLRNVVQLMDLYESTGAGTGYVKFIDASDYLMYKAPGDSYGIPQPIPTGGAVTDGSIMRLVSGNGSDYIIIYVADSSNPDWAPIIADQEEGITIYARPTAFELEGMLKIATVMYSGTATGFLGCGYLNVQQNPNLVINNRNFGTLGYDNIDDSVGRWKTTYHTTRKDIIYNDGNVGIGTNLPDKTLQIVNEDQWGVNLRSSFATLTNKPTVLTQRSLGTKYSPLTITNTTVIGGMSCGGFDGTIWTNGADGGVEILAVASENWTSAAHGAGLSIRTTKIGSISPTEVLTIAHNGAINATSIHSVAVGGAEYANLFTTTFSIADTGAKQALRVVSNVTHTSGTISSQTGIYSSVVASGAGGTTTSQYALYGLVYTAAGAIVTNSYGLVITDLPGGTTTTRYGVYVGIQNATTCWGLYVVGANSLKNKIDGDLCINRTSADRSPAATNPALDSNGIGIFREDFQTPTLQSHLASRHAQNCIVACVTFDFSSAPNTPTILGDCWNVTSISRTGVGTYQIDFDVPIYEYDRFHISAEPFAGGGNVCNVYPDRIDGTGGHAHFEVVDVTGVNRDVPSLTRIHITIIGRPFTMP